MELRGDQIMNNELRIPLMAGIAASLMLLAEPATASTQGSFGATSTGTLTINASVPGRVRISGLSDVTFSNVDPSTNASVAQNVCVWSNTSTRGYNITATGSGAEGRSQAGGRSAPDPMRQAWQGACAPSSASGSPQKLWLDTALSMSPGAGTANAG